MCELWICTVKKTLLLSSYYKRHLKLKAIFRAVGSAALKPNYYFNIFQTVWMTPSLCLRPLSCLSPVLLTGSRWHEKAVWNVGNNNLLCKHNWQYITSPKMSKVMSIYCATGWQSFTKETLNQHLIMCMNQQPQTSQWAHSCQNDIKNTSKMQIDFILIDYLKIKITSNLHLTLTSKNTSKSNTTVL